MNITTLILSGILLIAVAAVIALIFAIMHAEEGYEDDTGYHQKKPDPKPAENISTTAVDTGNPWDQVEGASCPWHFNSHYRLAGHNDFPAHKP